MEYGCGRTAIERVGGVHTCLSSRFESDQAGFSHPSSSNPLIPVPGGRSLRCCCHRSSNGKGSEQRNPRDDRQM
jgi:hypothetical protein